MKVKILADAKRLIYTLFVSHLNLSKYFVVGGEKIPESYDVWEYQKECKLLIVNQNKKYAGSYANSKQLLPSYPKNYFWIRLKKINSFIWSRIIIFGCS